MVLYFVRYPGGLKEIVARRVHEKDPTKVWLAVIDTEGGGGGGGGEKSPPPPPS